MTGRVTVRSEPDILPELHSGSTEIIRVYGKAKVNHTNTNFAQQAALDSTPQPRVTGLGSFINRIFAKSTKIHIHLAKKMA